VITDPPQELLPTDIADFVIEEIWYPNESTAKGIDEVVRKPEGFYITTGRVTHFVSNGEINENGDVEFYINDTKLLTTYGAVVIIVFNERLTIGVEYAPSLSRLVICQFNLEKSMECEAPATTLVLYVRSKNNIRTNWGTNDNWCLNTEKFPYLPRLSPDVRTGYSLPFTAQHPYVETFIWGKDPITGEVKCPMIEIVKE
jgi:hypothetical protein